MEENGASPTAGTGPKIEIDNANKVIKMIITPKGLRAEAQRERDRKIIGWRAWIVAPTGGLHYSVAIGM